MGGVPANYRGQAMTLKEGNPDTAVSGLMAVGEAACVSVHGANRLGSNSLLDLVVFGRAAANTCADVVDPNESHRPLPADAGQYALDRFDKLRHSSGDTPTAELRLRMQEVMQNNCAVFRTQEVMNEGVAMMKEVTVGIASMHDASAHSVRERGGQRRRSPRWR